jgi:hypothetical protein
MEETPIIITDRERLLILATAIILAGIASNYSTICPSESHVLIARSLAKTILNYFLTPSV